MKKLVTLGLVAVFGTALVTGCQKKEETTTTTTEQQPAVVQETGTTATSTATTTTETGTTGTAMTTTESTGTMAAPSTTTTSTATTTTTNSRGIRLGNFVQVRTVIEEELEGVETVGQAGALVDSGQQQVERAGETAGRAREDAPHRAAGIVREAPGTSCEEQDQR